MGDPHQLRPGILRRRLGGWLSAAILAWSVAAGQVGHAEVIDRIMAVVADQTIMLSDVRLADALGLVEPPGPGPGDPLRATLDRLIERALILSEVRRYSAIDPDEAAVAARLERVRAKGSGDAAFQAALAQAGVDPDQLREWVRDDLRIEEYLGQRFASVAQPSPADVAQYYREHPEEFTGDGRLRPLDEVSEAVATRLSATRRWTMIADWVETLRRRIGVTDLYLGRR